MVEIIPKESQATSKEASFSFYLVVSFFIFSIICFFVLNSLLSKAKEELSFLESSLDEIMTSEKKALQKEVLSLEGKINSFSFLVEDHLQLSECFEIIERKTHPFVWFSEFSLNSDKKEFKLSGETENFETLGQQILILQQEETINKVNLESFSINKDGKIDFSLSIYFKDNIFKPKFLIYFNVQC